MRQQRCLYLSILMLVTSASLALAGEPPAPVPTPFRVMPRSAVKVTAPPAPAAPAKPHQPITSRAARERILALYQGVERYAAEAGFKVRIDLRSCATSYQHDLGRQRWLALLTPGVGRVLELTPTIYSDRQQDLMGVGLAPRWATDPNDQANKEVVRQLQDLTAAAALRLIQQEHADLGQVDAVTSCAMTAAFGGEKRSYRSVFLWGPAKEASPLLYSDNVVSGMHQLDGLTLPVVKDLADLVERFGKPRPPTAVSRDAMSCTVLAPTTTTNLALGNGSSQQHTTGQHSSSFQLQATCQTNADCTSICSSPNLSQNLCADFGQVKGIFVHKATTAPALAGDQELNKPAVCVGAQGCAIESCVVGFCSGITLVGSVVQGQSATVALTSGKSYWFTVFSDKISCPQPQSVPPPPKKKVAQKRCICQKTASAGVPPGCSITSTCEDAADGETGYDTCDEAIQNTPDPSCGGFCGDGVCNNGETCLTCPGDCGDCPPTGYCGDGYCGSGEDEANCCTDCGCADPDLYTCENNTCTCTDSVVVPDSPCGSYTDRCGTVHDWGQCMAGEVCVNNTCQMSTSGGGGNGGGGGGSTCDPNGDGFVTADQCAACGGTIDYVHMLCLLGN